MSDSELISTVLAAAEQGLAAVEQWSADLRASVATKSREDPDQPLSYNQQDAARLLGITATALRDLRGKGEVEGAKLGKRIVYTRESLEQLLERNRKEAHTQGANSRGEGAP